MIENKEENLSIENEKVNIGLLFHLLRKEADVSRKTFLTIFSNAALSNFEAGKVIPDFVKMQQAFALLGITSEDFTYLLGKKAVYKQYGRIFHTIRIQRGYNDSFFENLSVSPYRLKLFEEGRIMLGYDIVDEMLQAIHVTEADFSHWLNNGMVDYFESCFIKIDIAYHKSDESTLKLLEQEFMQLRKDFGEEIDQVKIVDLVNDDFDYSDEIENITKQYTDYRVLELAAKSAYTILSEDEQIEISDFLMGIDIWTDFGLSIFTITVENLSYEMIIDIMREFIRKSKAFENNFTYRKRIIQASVKAVLALVNQGKEKTAQVVLNYSKKYLQHSDTYAHGIYKFAEGYVLYHTKDMEKGKTLMKQVIESFAFLEEAAISAKLDKFYRENIK